MSRKRLKQYLMLLMAIGVIAVVMSGGGTFASFNAEVTNGGNQFATGTLVLNDNGGTNTCTSAINTNNQNTAGTDCDTLFSLAKFAFTNTTIGGASNITSASTTMAVTTLNNGPIYPNDVLQLGSGNNTVTATSYLAANTSGTININATGLSGSYAPGTAVVDNNPTDFADLTLTNVGSLNAGDIYFKATAACTDAYGGGNTTLNMGTVTQGASTGATLTVASSTGFAAGDTLVVSEGGNAQSFSVTAVPSGTTVTILGTQKWNYAYDTSAVVQGVRLNGGTAPAMCSNLLLSITETGNTFNINTGSAGCAYGGTTSPEFSNACDFTGGTALSALPTTLNKLTLASGGGTGNTGGDLASGGGARYFVLAVHWSSPTYSNLANTDQNWRNVPFGLTWHIDQQ